MVFFGSRILESLRPRNRRRRKTAETASLDNENARIALPEAPELTRVPLVPVIPTQTGRVRLSRSHIPAPIDVSEPPRQIYGSVVYPSHCDVYESTVAPVFGLTQGIEVMAIQIAPEPPPVIYSGITVDPSLCDLPDDIILLPEVYGTLVQPSLCGPYEPPVYSQELGIFVPATPPPPSIPGIEIPPVYTDVYGRGVEPPPPYVGTDIPAVDCGISRPEMPLPRQIYGGTNIEPSLCLPLEPLVYISGVEIPGVYADVWGRGIEPPPPYVGTDITPALCEMPLPEIPLLELPTDIPGIEIPSVHADVWGRGIEPPTDIPGTGVDPSTCPTIPLPPTKPTLRDGVYVPPSNPN